MARGPATGVDSPPGAYEFLSFWRLYLRRRGSQTVAEWRRIAVASPRPRYGHSAIFGQGLPYLVDQGFDPAMVVFGGHDGAAETDSLWVLKLTPAAEQWSALSATGTPASPREGHTANQVPGTISGTIPPRMIVFGGRRLGGVLGDPSGLEWVASGPRWITLSPSNPPAARARHTMVHDITGQKLVLFGGTGASGAPLADAWALRTPAVSAWLASAEAPSPRAGHSSIFHPVPVLARTPEIFEATPDDLGSWTLLSTAIRKLGHLLDDRSAAVPAGVYFARLIVGSEDRVAKIGGERHVPAITLTDGS